MAFNLQLDQALSGTAQAVTDENGTTSPLTLSTGRIGIATTSPDAQLDVAGSGDSLMIVSDTANGNRLLIGTDDQLPTFLRLRPQSGAGLAITNDGDKIGIFVRASDGHVGVGTTDPQAHLDVVGSGDSLVTVADTANGNSLLIGTDDQLPGFLRLRPQSGAGLAITNDGDRIGIFVRGSDGHVGIGTTDPQAHLHVNGRIVARDIDLPALAQLFPATALVSIISNLQSRLRLVESRIGQVRQAADG